MGYNPPIVAFCSTGQKDTLTNIEATGEFVVNIPTMDLVEQLNLSATIRVARPSRSNPCSESLGNISDIKSRENSAFRSLPRNPSSAGSIYVVPDDKLEMFLEEVKQYRSRRVRDSEDFADEHPDSRTVGRASPEPIHRVREIPLDQNAGCCTAIV